MPFDRSVANVTAPRAWLWLALALLLTCGCAGPLGGWANFRGQDAPLPDDTFPSAAEVGLVSSELGSKRK